MDQSLLAAPHGFSQRATSFIASWCQGIHRMPFSSLNSPPRAYAREASPREAPDGRVTMHRNHPQFAVPGTAPASQPTPASHRTRTASRTRISLAQHTTTLAPERIATAAGQPIPSQEQTTRSDTPPQHAQKRTRT